MKITKDIIKETIKIGSVNNSDSVLDIAFGVDENFLKPAGIVISSILKCNNVNLLRFHIFVNEINKNEVNRYKKINGKADVTVHVFDDGIFKDMQERENLPKSMYYRLVAPHIISELSDKVLYLDADTLCLNKIDELINFRFDNNVACVINHKSIDISSLNGIDIKNEDFYFNSGVMLINIPVWIRNCVLNDFLSLIGKKKYNYPDQDVLNVILEGKVSYIDGKFNRFMEDVTAGDDTVFVHFTGAPKPWQAWYEKGDIYDSFYNSSPWSGIPYDLPITSRQMRIYSKKLKKQKKIVAGYYWFFKYLFNKILKK
ncbi:glycosyltransferase [Xenorhabdus sp. XENO-10]|uniref:Glycosyltransferase n=1 Tax=Xenorhabdus yunnanensis TaxID=3025878 RepID=A0ABT5LKU3_9GAMM|nr:glycosyltransferase [Xenorhabdus yunnanensis]MDC9591620.1 glycosyltransferase [Xenorhabdus yunnanensis]